MKGFIRTTLIVTALNGFLCLGAAAQSSNVSSSDKKFVADAVQGGMAEIQLGEWATENAASPEVKKFGYKMVNDHTEADVDLEILANKQGVTLPTSLTPEDKKLEDELSKLSGSAFDRMYMEHMVQDHKAAVNEFQQEAANGQDSALKSFAQKTLPTLQEHLKMAESLESSKSSTTKAGR